MRSMTAEPDANARFRRAIERRALWMAEDASCRTCRSRTRCSSSTLYAERGSPKYEKAALRWLERYMTESSSRLKHFAEIAASLAERAD